MSADNWTICPKCKKIAEVKKAKLVKQAKEGYGKLPAEDYENLLLESRKPIDIDATLREDYEFHMDDVARFTAEYSAHCKQCGFKHTFKHDETIEIYVNWQ